MRIATPFVVLAWLLATSGVLGVPLDDGLAARGGNQLEARASAKPAKTSKAGAASSKPPTPTTSKSVPSVSRSIPSPSSPPVKSSTTSFVAGASSVKPSSGSSKAVSSGSTVPSSVLSVASSAISSASQSLSRPSGGISSALPLSASASAPVSASGISASGSLPSGVSSTASASASASSSSASSSGIPGPAACPLRNAGSRSSSASAAPHPRDFAVRPRASSLPPCTDIPSCTDRGQQLWDTISQTTTDSSTDKTTTKYKASYASLSQPEQIVTNTNVGRQILSLFSKSKNTGVKLPPLANPLLTTLPKEITRRTINGRDAGKTAYENVYAPGVIVAVNNFKVQDPVTDATKQVNWNVIAFEQYKEFKGSEAPTDLRFVMRFHIDNPVTVKVLTDAYAEAGMQTQAAADDTEWTKWTYGESCTKKIMLALLATDNGKGAGFILADYAETLGGKKIAAIYSRRQETFWAMVVEYA